MKILVACEFSGVVREAFRKRGHDAWSCDLLPSDIPSPYHIQDDVLKHLDEGWDMMIAHPPCTWLCQAMRTNAARKDRPNITPIYIKERNNAFSFVLKLWNAPIEKIALENPIGYLNQSDVFGKPTQIIRPWMFGHPYRKDVCLWLKNLPNLIPTKIVDGRQKLDYWSTKRNPGGKSLKSITYQGIADAMAEQWSS